MKIAIVQVALYWENIQENLNEFQKKIEQLEPEVNLVVLPEMFSTGFTMNPKRVAQTEQESAVLWMQETAKNNNLAITGSLVIKENDQYYNRLFFVYPDGSYKTYNKRHLFTLAGEEQHYTKGENSLIINYLGWRIKPLICYDLRFPVFSRNSENYDLLIYVANWPERRILAWDTLLRARAIENMSYTIGVNRIGIDENKNTYCGHSQIIDAMGEYIIKPNTSAGIHYAELDLNTQHQYREKFGFLKDQDLYKIL